MCVRTIVYTIPYIRRTRVWKSQFTISRRSRILFSASSLSLFLQARFDEIVTDLPPKYNREKSATINSSMFLERVCLISAIFAVALAAPRISGSIPTWHLPCGELSLQAVSLKNLEEEMRTSLESLRLQHQLTMNDYLNRDYEYLYERVRIGVDDHQYIPNWVPGKKDVNLIRKLADANTPMVSVSHSVNIVTRFCRTCFEPLPKFAVIKFVSNVHPATKCSQHKYELHYHNWRH